MNGSKSPGPAARSADSGDSKHNDGLPASNGHRSPSADKENVIRSSPVPSIEGADERLSDAPVVKEPRVTNGTEDDAASEAETLIDSPVKRREAEKKKAAAAAEKPQKSRIGSLPVPQDDDDDADADGESDASPLRSTEVSTGKPTPSGDAKDDDAEMMDADEEDSDALSSARSSPNRPASRESSRSRAMSENPETARNGTNSPNRRKRKYRASSVSLPSNKRRSMDPPAPRRLRGMHSEDTANRPERSPSPKARSHRRTVSTQSALDGATDGGSRKRRANSQFPLRDAKSTKGWEESDASSETTSRGLDEQKRPQRATTVSALTPGRPIAREHKRHINKYGFTKLAEACEAADLDGIKEWREKDPGQLEVPEFAGNRPLQIAALNGNAEVVEYLIGEGCQIDCANADKDTPLIDAAENGHLEVVKLLLDAGVDPLRQNLKGQQALDVVTDHTEDAGGIRSALHNAIDKWNSSEAKQRREEEEEQRHRAGPSKELHFMARTYENLLKLVQNNDRNGVQEFLAARVPVDNAIIAAAAKTGDQYLVNMLMADMTERKRHQKPEKPLLSVLGTSHFEMLTFLTEMEHFNPLWRSRQGKTWPELAEERNGPMWKQERDLLQRLYDRAGGANSGGRRSSSPVTKREMGRRKVLQHQQQRNDEQEDESDEEEDEGAGATVSRTTQMKRKNGRRLMSRKDLRTAKGHALSESDDDEDDDAEMSDAPPTAEKTEEPEEAASMKPPDTPNTRRSRLRSNSQSNSPEVSPKSLRRKRSVSLRGSESGNKLETLKEEDKEDSGSIEVAAAAEKLRKDREEEAQHALELARQAEEKRKADEAAEAEAKRLEEELEAKRKAEEEAEQQRVEEEKARKEEEERLLREREREREEQRRQYKMDVVEALPEHLRYACWPVGYDPPEKQLKWQHEFLEEFAPLRVLANEREQDWVLNLHVAAMMGLQGLELFFDDRYNDWEHCLANQWSTTELAPGDWTEIDRLLLQFVYADGGIKTENPTGDMSYSEDLHCAAQRYNYFLRDRRKVKQVALRRVRLENVVNHIPWRVELEFAYPTPKKRDEAAKQLEIQGTQEFVGRMKAFWERYRVPGEGGEVGGACAGLTDVVVVHEK